MAISVGVVFDFRQRDETSVGPGALRQLGSPLRFRRTLFACYRATTAAASYSRLPWQIPTHRGDTPPRAFDLSRLPSTRRGTSDVSRGSFRTERARDVLTGIWEGLGVRKM